MRKALYAAFFALMAALGQAAWHRNAPRVTPPSQPPLASLSPGDLWPVRDLFNSSADTVRILLMLSPT